MFKYRNKLNGKIATQEFDIRYYLIENECHVPSWIVEKSNDWELVKEKEWEVIQYNRLAAGVFTISYDIKTVKRLSDNTIFSIGDKIKCQNSHVDKPEPITRIEINKEGTPCLFTKSFHNNGVNIFKAIKCIFLFVTEDGIEIFEGDKYWEVVLINNSYNIRDMLADSTSNPCRDYYITFSTEKAAKDWIDMNKPQFSKQQILSGANELCWIQQSAENLIYMMNTRK